MDSSQRVVTTNDIIDATKKAELTPDDWKQVASVASSPDSDGDNANDTESSRFEQIPIAAHSRVYTVGHDEVEGRKSALRRVLIEERNRAAALDAMYDEYMWPLRAELKKKDLFDDH